MGQQPVQDPWRLSGFRVSGPCDPARGRRHNPAKLLQGPFARASLGRVLTLKRTIVELN
jgi:isoamylase